MQHHDAIVGTEQQHVAYDYAHLLSSGFKSSGKIASQALKFVKNYKISR